MNSNKVEVIKNFCLDNMEFVYIDNMEIRNNVPFDMSNADIGENFFYSDKIFKISLCRFQKIISTYNAK